MYCFPRTHRSPLSCFLLPRHGYSDSSGTIQTFPGPKAALAVSLAHMQPLNHSPVIPLQKGLPWQSTVLHPTPSKLFLQCHLSQSRIIWIVYSLNSCVYSPLEYELFTSDKFVSLSLVKSSVMEQCLNTLRAQYRFVGWMNSQNELFSLRWSLFSIFSLSIAITLLKMDDSLSWKSLELLPSVVISCLIGA